MGRAVLWGLGAAAGGAVLLATMLLTIGAARILGALATGYLVGKAVSKATGDYGGRRYQVLAVLLTYFAIGLGSLAPVVKAFRDGAPEAQQSAQAAPAADDEADEADEADAAQLEEELLAMSDDGNHAEDLAAENAGASTRASARDASPDSKHAERLGAGGFLGMLGGGIVLVFTLPLLSLISLNPYAVVIRIAAFGYGMYKAWELTERAVDMKIGGPYRVGTGPVRPNL